MTCKRKKPIRKFFIELSNRTPDEWVQQIEQIENEHVKNKVGSIVWYDWFGGHNYENRVTHFDGYVQRYNWRIADDDNLVFSALLRLGYNKEQATKRSTSISLTSSKHMIANNVPLKNVSNVLSRDTSSDT